MGGMNPLGVSTLADTKHATLSLDGISYVVQKSAGSTDLGESQQSSERHSQSSVLKNTQKQHSNAPDEGWFWHSQPPALVEDDLGEALSSASPPSTLVRPGMVITLQGSDKRYCSGRRTNVGAGCTSQNAGDSERFY